MKTNRVAVAALIAVVAAPAAFAQEAVQWRVEDGGNGHWYQGIVISQEGVSWTDARSTAISWGADLVVLDSSTVAEWVWQHVANDSMLWSELFGPWVGAYQPAGSPEPDAGWVWVNGLAVVSSIDWGSGQPDNYIPCGGENDVMSYFTDYQSRPRNLMCDTADVPVVYCPGGSLGPTTSAVIEWSADCNGDGIVDYGQILDGTLIDADSDGIPDCCALGFDCSINLVANGGFELGPVQDDCTWVNYSAGSKAIPGWTITAGEIDRVRRSPSCPANESWLATEGEYTVDLVGFVPGELRQVIPTVPGATYRLSFQLTINGGAGSTEEVAVMVGDASEVFTVSGQPGWPQPWAIKSLDFVAPSATTALTFASLTPAPGGPVIDDVRVAPYPIECIADLNDDGVVGGADISVLLGYWGLSGKNVVGDLTGDGTVNGADLSVLLGSWGPCK